MCQRSITIATTSKTENKDRLCAGIQRKASRVHSKKSGDGTQGIQGGRESCDGLGCDLYHVWAEHARAGLVVKAGMTPEQALRTATTNAAELLGKEKELGAVAPGYFADLVAVEGDP